MIEGKNFGRCRVACWLAVLLFSGCSQSTPPASQKSDGPSSNGAPEISLQREAGKIHVRIAGQFFTSYHFEEKWDKPFLHPVRALSGREVSRGWPVDPRPGESDDHIWHRGLFMGHDRINGVDFWRELGRDKTGTLVPRSPPTASVSDGAARISAELDLLTPDGESLGAIRQGFTFTRLGTSAVIDVEVTVRADRGTALRMGDTEEGWVGFRFDDAFQQENGATLMNSGGLVGTENIWGQRAEWVDYSTTLQGEKAGVALFDHPANPGHPTYWHARGYGLCTANPFGERSFTGDEARDGTMEVPEGGQIEFRYRLVVHPGSALDAEIEQLYSEYRRAALGAGNSKHEIRNSKN